ncbi:hypothetical protein C8J57DRAFT_152081 [Mycena rebaudengoi]|nr:hypothetical protein C8J57DRAFT_152081 [Mycena rebaudengoi]
MHPKSVAIVPSLFFLPISIHLSLLDSERDDHSLKARAIPGLSSHRDCEVRRKEQEKPCNEFNQMGECRIHSLWAIVQG